MREEIAAAVVFLTRLVKKNKNLTKEQVTQFSSCLSAILAEKFKNHWYGDQPTKGQGYRCIRVNESEPMDPVLEQAAAECGLKYRDLNMPLEFTLWVDPLEVCCRFGESIGSHFTIAEFSDGQVENRAHSLNIDNALEEQNKRKSIEAAKLQQYTSHRTTKSNLTKGRHNQQNLQQQNRIKVKCTGGKEKPVQKLKSAKVFSPAQSPKDRYHWVKGADLVKA